MRLPARGRRRIKAATVAVVLWSVSVASAPSSQQAQGTGFIVGQVVDALSPRGVSGAVVTLKGAGVNESVLTESQGRFVFRDLPAGTFTLTASKPGWAAGMYSQRRPGGTSHTLDLAEGERLSNVTVPVWRHAAIAGTLRDEHGDPLVGVQVRALARAFRTGDARWVTVGADSTDDRGAYRIGALTPGEYTVVVPSTQIAVRLDTLERTGGSSSASVPEGNGVVTFDVGTRHAVAVGDHVLWSGVPPAPGREAGRPHAYRTTFYPNAVTSTEATSITLRSGDERPGVDFNLSPVPTVVVSGIVTANGAPMPGARLQLFRAAIGVTGRVVAISDIQAATTFSGAGGVYMFPTVPLGQMLLRVSAPDPNARATQLWASLPISIDNVDITNLHVPLQPGLTVSGAIEFDGTGPRPDAGRPGSVRVSVEALDPRNATTRAGPVTAGRFTIQGRAAGEYVLRIPDVAPGWTVKSVTMSGVDVTDRVIDITSDLSNLVVTYTNRASGISGRVVGPAGADPTATVIVFPVGVEPREISWNAGSRRFTSLRVSKDGSFAFGGIPAGEYLVIAIPEEAAGNWIDSAFLTAIGSSATTVRVVEGQTRAVDLRTVPVQR